jgi:hypothetical protein
LIKTPLNSTVLLLVDSAGRELKRQAGMLQRRCARVVNIRVSFVAFVAFVAARIPAPDCARTMPLYSILIVNEQLSQGATDMNAPIDLAILKGRQQAAWASGDYAVIGTTLQIVGLF